MNKGLQVFVPLNEVGSDPVSYTVAATPAEMSELRSRFGLVELDALSAELEIVGMRNGSAARIAGKLRAAVKQSCVVSLEPVVQTINESFMLEFGEAADVIDAATGEMIVVPDQDQPEPMPASGFAIGDIVTEQFALALDPYPRKEGVDLEAVLRQNGIQASSGDANPFAALAALKTRG